MSARKKGLGRGLDALLGLSEAVEAEGTAAPAIDQPLQRLPLDLVQRGRYQPRMEIKPESLQELADSIRAQGVMQPILVRPLPEKGRFEIIAGERRWRAAQLAELQEIPAIICDVGDDVAMSMALIENIQREELNPLEEANALHRLVNEFEMTHQQVAEAIGRSRVAVTNLLRLLELEFEVKRLLETGDIEMGHARALLTLKGEAQRKGARQVVARGLSVRETERLVRRLAEQPQGAAPAHKRPKDPDILRLEEDLTERLGASVTVQHGLGGKGTLTIRYNSLDELDGILDHIK